jgi:hypothetical protein
MKPTTSTFRRKFRALSLTCAVLSIFAALATPLHASLYTSTLSWQYYAYGSAYHEGGQNGGTFVNNGVVGGTFSDGSTIYFNIIADATSITFDYSAASSSLLNSWSDSELSYAPTVHNGVVIDLISGAPFSSVTIDPASNMAGFDASRFSFTGNQIQVDWQLLPFSRSTIVKLDVQTVPEPSSLCLLGTGAILLGCRFRRR